jgi:hypothetical protein
VIPAEQVAALLVTVTGCGIAIVLARAFAHRLKGPSAPQVDTRVVEELEEMRTQMGRLQGQLDEVLERQDFTERVLAQARERGALPGGKA